MRSGAIAALSALLVTAGAGAAQAQSYTAEQEQACTPDAMRLCASYIPDVGRITACMHQRRAELSPPCAAYFRPQASVEHRSPRRPATVMPAKRKPAVARAPTKGKSAARTRPPARKNRT